MYLLLCLNTANTDGRLMVEMNELIVPYDIEKIVRDTKYFDFDTVAVALDLYKKLGLIYVADDNILKIANFDDLVGSETKWAKYKRNKKLEKVQLDSNKSIENKKLEKKIIENKKIDLLTHNYECHLKKTEKDSFCLGCQKKNVCNKKTSDAFYKIYGSSFEEYINGSKQKNENTDFIDYDWLNEDREDDAY